MLPRPVRGSLELHEEQPQQQILVRIHRVQSFKVPLQFCVYEGEQQCLRMWCDTITGAGPPQPSVCRAPGWERIALRTKAATPKCVSPRTSWRSTSSRKRRNEIRSAPSSSSPSCSSSTPTCCKKIVLLQQKKNPFRLCDFWTLWCVLINYKAC